jgi:hypothetical protein
MRDIPTRNNQFEIGHSPFVESLHEFMIARFCCFSPPVFGLVDWNFPRTRRSENLRYISLHGKSALRRPILDCESEALNVDLPLRARFEQPTIADLGPLTMQRMT